MMVISPSEFRANQRKYFDLASTERVIIRRSKAQSFALVPTHDEEFTISEELKRKISQAREDYKEGKGVSCKNFEDSLNLLESL
jgi:PHD/YefM family antitoxin component YafN of YafNO toxin-antitoxin module